jgi:hypothetical protein
MMDKVKLANMQREMWAALGESLGRLIDIDKRIREEYRQVMMSRRDEVRITFSRPETVFDGEK